MINEFYIYSRWEKLGQKIEEDIKYSDNRYRLEALPFEWNNPVFLSDNIKGNKSIYIEFHEDEIKDYVPLQINGLDIKVTANNQISSNMLYLNIALHDIVLEPAFLAFTSSIITNIQLCTSSLDSINTIENIIKKYTDFFSKKNINKITSIKEQGLFAELYELSYQIDKRGEECVKSWEGPEKRRRDFVFEDCDIEIKSTSKINDMTVTITSENQLEPSTNILYLHVYVLEKANTGFTIVDIINEIIVKLVSIHYQKMFIGKLFLLGIDPLTYETESKYKIVRITSYEVNESFPRVKKLHIPNEVFEITYKLDLKSIKGEPLNHD